MSTTIATPRRSERLAAKAAGRRAEDLEAAAVEAFVASQASPQTTEQERVINTIRYYLANIDYSAELNTKMIGVCSLFNYCVRQKAMLERPRFARFVEELHKKVEDMQYYRESTEASAPHLMAACDRVKATFSS